MNLLMSPFASAHLVNLKDNDRQLDLEDRTLYTTILKKIPEKMLPQYCRWIKIKSLKKLKDWVEEEAEYQVQVPNMSL